jgi:hypothetical protein
MSIKATTFNHIKNIAGWRTNRKLLVFSVDDYGNVRVDSKKAFENINKKNPIKEQRFDRYDTLETREDLEMLFEVLSSVKDKNGINAVFTPYALSCNIDFERMREEGYQTYRYELLSRTFEKLSALQPAAYQGAWDLWKQGIEIGLMCPEFHGREHFNIKVFEEKLAKKDSALMLSLENRSLANIGPSCNASIGWTAAFSFWDPVADTQGFPNIIKEGLAAFEQVYGYKSKVFTPPARHFPSDLEKNLNRFGFIAYDRPFNELKHLGYGKFKRQFAFTGYKKDTDMVELVRNVVFEPTASKIDHVAKAMQQIEAAFCWNKPALISSHRVNFCGHINPKNRELGLGNLKTLLKAIVKKWPEVEFLSVDQLVTIINNDL